MMQRHIDSTRSRRSALRPLARLAAIVTMAALIAGCAAGRAARRGDAAARVGDWDGAVEQYRQAVQREPNRADYRIALERAMISASQLHLDQARVFEARGQLEDALREYRRASEFDPPNRQIAAKAAEIERRIREQIEASRPQPTVTQMREAARQTGPPPLFNLTTVLPGIRFVNTPLRDILNTIGMTTGINIQYDSTFQDRTYTVQLDEVTLEEALNQILTANQLFFKVVNQRSIIVVPDTPAKRAQYEEQVVQTFFISHADATELAQLINTVIRIGGGQLQPMVAPNKTANTITIRATTAVAAIIERIIVANDKPRAEIVVDVQILEVNRQRAKLFGIELDSYSISAVFSPEVDPRTGDGLTSPPFNATTVSRGVSTSDFYFAVPGAAIRFLESDTETKLVAKPQLRGAEGTELTLELGEDVPIPSTTFTPVAGGGAAFNPLTSFNYRPVGVIVRMTPRVTYEGDIILDLIVESSSRGTPILVGDQNLPSFNSRKVQTRLRLRDGESNLLAGLLRQDEQRLLRGFPGILRLPVLRQLFARNETEITNSDIVMLLTPRLVRTHQLTQQDVSPIYIGTQQNLGLGGPPPLIAQPPAAAPAAEPAAVPAPEPQGGAGAVQGAQPPVPGGAVVPPGSSPIPGTTTLPDAAAPAGVPRDAVEPALPPPPEPEPSPAVAAAGGQIVVSPPGTDFRVGGGPYTVPISITGASRISAVSLTITYNPAVLRVRTVQEGSFMRSGGIAAPFTQQVDAAAGRIDIAVVRTGDAAGVAGTGLLAALLFDATGPGPANLTVTGTGSAPGGAPLTLQFAAVPAVVVR